MALTPSTMAPLGTPAPDFRLPDTYGKTVSLSDFADAPALLVAFICNHCPYVKHVREAFARLASEYQGKGVAVVGINSNDPVSHPGDSPDKMKEEKAAAGYTFPYLFDATQEVAKAYRAACTPHFFVYGRDRKLFYRGQMDAVSPRCLPFRRMTRIPSLKTNSSCCFLASSGPTSWPTSSARTSRQVPCSFSAAALSPDQRV